MQWNFLFCFSFLISVTKDLFFLGGEVTGIFLCCFNITLFVSQFLCLKNIICVYITYQWLARFVNQLDLQPKPRQVKPKTGCKSAIALPILLSFFLHLLLYNYNWTTLNVISQSILNRFGPNFGFYISWLILTKYMILQISTNLTHL